jgi:hypothetical protein
MNKEQLKELVKAHFNLVEHTPSVTEEKFGMLYDENKAFQIKFPGDKLKVGDEVKVVTAEGQESLAPDGYHRLEDGTMIKTEGSSVTEISTPETEAKEDEMADENPGLAAKNEEEAAAEKVGFAGPKQDISNVEGTTPQNSNTVTDASVAELTGPVDTEAKQELAKMKEEMKSMRDEMKSMKAKFEELAKSPAKGKTMMSAESKETFTNDSLQSKQMNIMRELIKNKK